MLIGTNSIGLCLVIWFLCGIVALLSALCYAELGILIKESGGEFIYILRGYSTFNKNIGRMLAFGCSWSNSIMLRPIGFSVMSLACAKYIVTPIIGCAPPPVLVRIVAFLISSILQVFMSI